MCVCPFRQSNDKKWFTNLVETDWHNQFRLVGMALFLGMILKTRYSRQFKMYLIERFVIVLCELQIDAWFNKRVNLDIETLKLREGSHRSN